MRGRRYRPGLEPDYEGVLGTIMVWVFVALLVMVVVGGVAAGCGFRWKKAGVDVRSVVPA